MKKTVLETSDNKTSKYYQEARKKILAKRKPYQKKRVIVPIITAVAFLVFGIFSCIYSSFYQTTDDAFVEAHLVYLSPKVSGEIIELKVDDNTKVKEGEIIAQIDPKNYQLALENAQAKLEKARHELKISDSDIEKMGALSSQSINDIKSAKSNLEYANNDYIRYRNAFKDGSVTQQDLDKATKNLEVARSQYKASQDDLKAKNSALESTISKKNSQNAEIKKLISEVNQAKLNLSYTTIVSPINGTITNKNIELGSYVQTAHPIMTIVPFDTFVVANFKETQVAHMKKGQKVEIKIDTYGSKKFKGVVDSIQQASGAKASLFPPENAVGSYVKVVQRIPVKIKFTQDISNYTIVPGMSVVSRVKVRGK